jgi:nucleoside-diphosphate-sugar epimerase
MRVVIIGGTGHIGSFLTPRLVAAGHTVTCVSRGISQPYHENPAWKSVTRLELDRTAEDNNGTFGERVARLNPGVVIDLTCYTLASAEALVDSLCGRIGHFLHCGTIWVHGPSVEVPTTEEEPRAPFGQYGIRKAAIETYLLQQAKTERFPVTLLHPGHIVGAGWAPLNPTGNFNPDVFSMLMRGDEIRIPNLGLETVHHVHADDVALAFMRALEERSAAVGECFHVASPAALTLRGYAERMGQYFGRPARMQFLPWEEWRSGVTETDAAATWDHIAHSPNCSIAKARSRLGFEPRYTSMQAVIESVDWLVRKQIVRSD